MSAAAHFPLILAIDTSCDETAVAVTRGSHILSNVVASQVQLHKEFGGVFPTVAKQAHMENLPRTVTAALKRAKVSWSEIEVIGVTQGPGLAPALEVGLRYAQELGQQYNLPVIGVNHIEGHVLSVLAESETYQLLINELEKPILSIIISGGHSEFILIKGQRNYQRLGFTIDDAAGECLDKVGRMLGLGYPAGPVIEEFAKKGDAARFTFPLPMTTSGDFNVSFSGLKTSAKNMINEREKQTNGMNKQDVYDFCASFQKSIWRHIVHKLNKLLDTLPEVEEVWLGGGVAANMNLRAALRAALRPSHRRLVVPKTKKLCGDNAAMIGLAAGISWNLNPHASTSLDRRPNWRIDEV
jgi:N6-L-threonylcarbamoyladenine synthase